MTHVSILIPQGHAVLNSIVRVFKIFNWVNDYLARNGGRPLFDLHLVGMAPRADLYGDVFSVMPDLTLADGCASDLIIIPALAGDMSEALKSNAAFIPWIKKQYKMGSEIASLCTGAFLVAATGLMDGNKPTTHWFVAADCRNAFCQIKLGSERMIMKEQRIHSAGGAYSSLNLLVEKFAGVEVALACSTIFETDFNRECQSVVTIFNKQQRRKGRGIGATQQSVGNNLRGKISREQFAGMFVLNRRNLKRYGNTDVVMHEVCYNNSRAFREIFNKMTGF